MRRSCAMMSSRDTPLVEEEGADMDGAKGVGGVAVYNWICLKRSCAKLRFTVVASMAHINEK